MIHEFAECLKRSASYAEAPWWETVYRRAFPGFLAMHSTNENGWWQGAGIDRVVILRNSRVVLIDEKVREKTYPDILLERWAKREKKSAGWVQKPLAIDFIAYAFAPCKTCYLLPFSALRAAWRQHGKDWCKRYPTILAQNKTYITESIAIPVEVLLEAIKETMCIQWGKA